MGDESREILQVEDDSYDLHKCSSGLALQGVLLTNQLKDQLKIRQHLIEVPKEVIVTKPSQSEEITCQFSSKINEEYFKEKVIVLGYGIALSNTNPVYGGVTICKTESEKAGQNGQAYLSTVKCSVIETATYSFRRSSLELTKEVSQDLHKLLETLKEHGEASVYVYEECAIFFDKYGSHVNLGPLTYGGHILYTCYSREFSESRIESVKDMQQDVVSSVNNNITLTSFDENQVNFNRTLFEDKYTSDVLKATQLKVKVTGGSLKALDISQWKKELVSNKSSWVLVNRGKKLIAVWDIIKVNYEQEFRPLIKVLKASWEKMTGFMAELNWLELLSYDVNDKLQEVSKWNEEKKLTNEQIKQRLEHLLRVKSDIPNLRVWINSYLMCPTLQTFLVSVVNAGVSSSDPETIVAIMRKLVEQEELDQLNLEDHPSMKKVSDFLYKSSRIDLQGFNCILKEALKQMKLGDSNESKETITKSIEKELSHLQSHYQNKYEGILIAILIYRFQCSLDATKLVPFSAIDLEVFYCSFSEGIKRFKKYEKNKTRCLLLMAIEQKPLLVNHFKNFMISICQMIKEVQPPSEEELLQRFNKAFHADSAETTSSVEDFKQHLESSHGLPTPRQPSISNSKSLEVANQTDKNEPVFDERQSSMLKEHPVAYDLFNRLGISDKYPQKLSLIDALCIRSEPLVMSLKGNPPTDLNQLPHLVLHKLMSYDLKCRSDLMSVIQLEDTEDDNDDDDYVDSDDEDIDESISNQQKESFKGVHPVDCLLSLILCSDDFLCQDLFSRLAKCQIAVPFLLPDPFTKQLTLRLFAMLSIIKEWNVVKTGDEVDELVHSIIDYPMPIISFVRFGIYQDRGASSKSRILNMVISSDSRHDFFFQRDCLVGKYDRILGEGFVDICWYLPTGKPSDTFNSPIAFLNLHGDARHHNDQMRFLSQISFMCFVLISEEDLTFDDKTMESLNQLNTSPGGISILNDVKGKPRTLKKAFPKSTVTNLISRTSADITGSIQKKIKMKLEEESNVFIPIRKVCVGKDIALDEDDRNYKECSEHASRLMSIITSHKDKKISVKEAMLPLQGEKLWKTWAALDRELHRQTKRGNMSVNDYTAEIEANKAAIRSKQLKHVDSLEPLMDSFIKSLVKFGGKTNRILRNYFLQSLNLDINSISRASISGMQHQYQSKRKALFLLQNKSADKGVCEAEENSTQLKEELEILQEKIINCSFGLEHLFRELGQVYEAALESQEYDDFLSQLPRAAAELLIDGYPLELMDGDAAHVPVDWITAVLNETEEILENPKVFVLSVLGLQSTGKSTMLNATFGVQFNVSAGRCTRGAFMQLLPLDKELGRTTGCRYVLLVDTEGLRAPELDSLKTQKHDNELATFVIGLANMTLINIDGQVPGDMDDILQTSVHAFLRMTEIKYHPSCQFVHQNAGASVKAEVGRAKFTQKLNQFTLNAAREEQREGQYQCFNDVIHFNDQTDIHHFAGLWKGDPPMAPINEGYSNDAQALKLRVIEVMCHKAKSSDLSLSSFRVKINDLWNTLLKEKFIFSFKNTLEIIAYNSLEASYSQWAWTFQEAMLKWEQEAENEITTLKPDENISDLVTQKIDSVKEYAMRIHQPLKERMDEFFNGNQSDILFQWKAEFEIRLDNLLKELLGNAENHCNELLRSRQTISQFIMQRMKYAEYVKEKVQHQLKSIKKEQEELKVSLEKGKLEPHQLEKLLKRNLFSTQKLKMYVEQQLITPSQEIQVRALCRDQLTASSINQILVGGILSEVQVKNILKNTRQTDEELKNDFESIWKEMTSSLVKRPPFKSVISVKKMVETKLHEYVRAKGLEGKWISRLQEAKIREWGSRIDFIPEITKHFSKHRFIATKFYHTLRHKDPDQEEANHITEYVLGKVYACVQEMVKIDTNFNAAFTIKLLNLVDSEITEQSSVRKFFTFSKDYRLDMYLMACEYAIPKFELMAELFRKQNDPLLYLEREVKGPEFIKFKNQYHQREVEEAVADTLCAYLEEPIKVQIGKSLCREMVTKMKSSAQHFSSKMALKVKVLIDLLQEDVFENYMVYVINVQKCLEDRIHNYTIKYCDEKYRYGPGSSTRLQQAAKEEVTRFINIAEELVIEVEVPTERNDETESSVIEVKIEDWLFNFSKNQKFRGQFGVCLEPQDLLSGYDGSQMIDLKAFIKKVKDGLKELEKTLHVFYQSVKCEEEMVQWKDKPHEILKVLVGCTAQCPFCGEQCDLLDPDHAQKGIKHKTEVHRMDCLAGWRDSKTQIMVTNFCPVVVDSDGSFYKPDDTIHPYRRYQEVYEDWSIPPDKTSKANILYWKWFMGAYKDKIAVSFAAKPPRLPSEWTTIEKAKIVKNLKQVYNI